MNKLMMLSWKVAAVALAFTTLGASSARAAGEGPTPTVQRMNRVVNKIQTQHVPHLQAVLESRLLPKSVVNKPKKIVDKSLATHINDRTQLGMTSEPIITEGLSTSLTVNGNANSKVDGQAILSTSTGNVAGVAANQYVQVTTQTVTPTVKRDPRVGIAATALGVTQWKASGPSVNNQVTGFGHMRVITPISPDLTVTVVNRAGHPEKHVLPAGTQLVTVTHGGSMPNAEGKLVGQTRMTFDANNQPAGMQTMNNAAPMHVSTYLLVPKTGGGFKKVAVDATQAADLRASTASKSVKFVNGRAVDNAAPGYDEASLREQGFLQ